ncbi:MAG TPA: hypothetical protein DHW20_01810 [Gemmatimonadetes bacterium]|nr:hypothetical protein [Gemmatimonadota bacterium]|tara:strand:+ start:11852 stop:12085 length:234 start_codon:yes stop_codon:yes gene_type:complete
MKLNELKSGAAGVQELVDAMHQQHRTTQALVAETLLRAMRRWANESIEQNRLDPRNETAARKVKRLLDDKDLALFTC